VPPYATAFCAMLAEYVREVFPISRPSEPKTETLVKRATARAECVRRRARRQGPRR
jgi:hypothetical protein